MSEYYIIHSDDELYHHGIKGMHWGVRRYQNPDGTLTEAGKRRVKKYDRRINKYANRIGKRTTRMEDRLNKFNNSKRKQKLLTKKAVQEQKVASVSGRNQHIRDRLQLNSHYNPGIFGRHRLKKEWRARKKLDRINNKLLKPEVKYTKDAFKNWKDLDKLNSTKWKKQALTGKAYANKRRKHR